MPVVAAHPRRPAQRISRIRRATGGQGAVEYGLVLALIALVVIAAFAVVGRRSGAALCRAGAGLGGTGCYSAVRGGGTGADRAMAITVAGDGTSYVYGNFTGSATFGNTTLTSAGGLDLYVAQVSRNGDWEWATSLGGAGDDIIASGMALDSAGALVIGGTYTNSVAFAGSTLSYTGAGAFVARLSSSGTWLWAQSITAAGGTVGSAGAGVDAAGNVYTAGTYTGTLSLVGSALTLPAPGLSDAFVASLSSSGAWTWALEGGGPLSAVTVSSIAVDGAGNSSIAGSVTNVSTFGNSLSSSGYNDIFVARASPTGAWLWGASGGGTTNDVGFAVAVDAAGNSYISGTCCLSPTTFTGATGNPVSLPANTVTSTAYSAALVAKISPSGAWVWATSTAGDGFPIAYGVAVDGSGNVYAAVSANGSIMTFNTDVGPTSGGYDMVAAKLNPAGVWQWARRVGGSKDDLARAAAVDASGALYIAGDITALSGAVAFGPTSITSAGDRDAILARWNSDGSQTAG